MKRLSKVGLFLLVLLGCTGTMKVSGASATVLPPDPVLTCTTPVVTLKPGQQGTLHWEASVPVATTTSATASILATYADSSTVTTPAGQATTLIVSEPTATSVAFSWTMPSSVTFVSGTVTKVDGTTAAVPVPTGSTVTAALGSIAAGQKASIAIVVQAKTG
jgi:hypothetical protein